MRGTSIPHPLDNDPSHIKIDLPGRPPREGYDPVYGKLLPWNQGGCLGLPGVGGPLEKPNGYPPVPIIPRAKTLVQWLREDDYGGPMRPIYIPKEEGVIEREFRRWGLGGLGGTISVSGDDKGPPTLNIGGALPGPAQTPLDPTDPGWGNKETVVPPRLVPKPGDPPLGTKP